MKKIFFVDLKTFQVFKTWKVPRVAICLLLTVNCLLSPSCQKKKEWQFTNLTQLSSYEISDLKRVNDSTIIGCGGDRYALGEFYFSSDNGNSFSKLDAVDKQLYGVDALNENSFFACGYDGKILHSSNSGVDWSLYQHNLWRPLKNILCVNDSVVIACGGSGFTNGVITRSTDGGQNFSNDTFKSELRGLTKSDEHTIFCSGYGIILKSTDDGTTWQQQKAEGDFFVSISFFNPQHGIAIGLAGTILLTDDAGATWKKIRNGNSLTNQSWKFRRIIFRDETSAYIIGDNGLLLYSADGGEHWFKIKNTPDENIFSIVLTTDGGIIGTQEGNIYRFLQN